MNFPRNRQIVTYIFSVSLLLFALSPAYLPASTLTLAWDPNTEPDLAGYRVYYGTVSGGYVDSFDVGNTTSYQLDGLLDNVTYYIAVTAYDTSGNESDFSNEVFGVSIPDVGSGSKEQYAEWGCFIATAAYESTLSNEVDAFKQFRDKYLLNNKLGMAFVSVYYKYSPPLADCIAKHPMLRKIVRIGLYPILELSRWLVGENNSE